MHARKEVTRKTRGKTAAPFPRERKAAVALQRKTVIRILLANLRDVYQPDTYVDRLEIPERGGRLTVQDALKEYGLEQGGSINTDLLDQVREGLGLEREGPYPAEARQNLVDVLCRRQVWSMSEPWREPNSSYPLLYEALKQMHATGGAQVPEARRKHYGGQPLGVLWYHLQENYLESTRKAAWTVGRMDVVDMIRKPECPVLGCGRSFRFLDEWKAQLHIYQEHQPRFVYTLAFTSAYRERLANDRAFCVKCEALGVKWLAAWFAQRRHKPRLHAALREDEAAGLDLRARFALDSVCGHAPRGTQPVLWRPIANEICTENPGVLQIAPETPVGLPIPASGAGSRLDHRAA